AFPPRSLCNTLQCGRLSVRISRGVFQTFAERVVIWHVCNALHSGAWMAYSRRWIERSSAMFGRIHIAMSTKAGVSMGHRRVQRALPGLAFFLIAVPALMVMSTRASLAAEAQSQGPPAGPRATSASETQGEVLDEIIVTARRRAESLQLVPLAIA